MNIVILTSLLPYPLNSGGAQAQYNMIDSLRSVHKFVIVFPENGYNQMDAMLELQKRWPEVEFKPYRYYRQLASLSFFVDKIKRSFNLLFRNKSRAFQIERILKPYGFPVDNRFVSFVNRIVKEHAADYIQVEFYPFLSLIPRMPAGIKKLFVHHEIRYVRNNRLLADYQLTKSENTLYENLRNEEIANLNHCDKVVTLTNVDKLELLKSGVKSPIYVSPAAVSTEQKEYKSWNRTLVFLGSYSHFPNQEGVDWLIQKVLPLMDWKKNLPITLHLVGLGWPKSYNRTINGLEIVCDGYVENLSDILSGSIMLVPILSGSGMRMKILEAAALNVPFVTTSVGVEGLDFVDGESCLIADEPATYAEAIFKLVSDQTLHKSLAEAASVTFEQKYSLAALSKCRDSVYKA